MIRNQNQSDFIPVLLLLLGVAGVLALGVGGYKYLTKERLDDTPQVSADSEFLGSYPKPSTNIEIE